MRQIIFKITTLIFITVLLGCNSKNSQGPYKMYTKINTNGSCYREFVRDVDSAFAAGDTTKNPFPIKLDSSWQRNIVNKYYTVHTDGKTNKKDSFPRYIVLIHKNYSSVSALADSFRFYKSGWDSIIPQIAFKKKFRWFYTYFEFKETYPKVNPFKTVPVTNYLSTMEIETLYGNNTELYKGKIGVEIKDMLIEMENKSNAWLNRSLYEEFYKICLLNFHKLKNMPIDSLTFARAKNDIYKLNSDSTKNDINIEAIFDTYFKTNFFSKNKIFDEFNEEYKKVFENLLQYYFMELDYGLSMPGKYIETNTPIVHSDTLSWKINADRILLKDCTLTATSRKSNYWAFAVTAVIVVFGILGLWIKRK